MAVIFFGLGTGRIASMALANYLNSEANCLCLHEGKIRRLEAVGEQVLPFLTLQNRLAYEDPAKAASFVKTLRGDMVGIAGSRGVEFIGDIAYNNAPFVSALHAYYPHARFFFVHRDCMAFVRSCTALEGDDATPVGWPPEGRGEPPVEQFIALGRLQPRAGSREAELWPEWDFICRNIWLWAETNRLILDQLAAAPAAPVFVMRFEAFTENPVLHYDQLRAFLGFTAGMPPETRALLAAPPINRRHGVNNRMTFADLSDAQKKIFLEYAQPVRLMLGYNS